MSNKEKQKDNLKSMLMDNRESILDYQKSKNYVLERKRTKDFLEDDRMSPLNDVMFKTVFQNTSRKKFACYLLYAALDVGLSYKFICEHVDFYKNVVDSNHVSNKKEMQDLVMKLDDDTLIGIELNNYNVIERNLDYASRIAASDVSVGEEYIFNAVLLINLNNYSFDKYNKQRDTFYIQNDEKILYAKRSFVEIYLPKINEKWYNGGKASMTKKEQILLCMFTSSKEIANDLAEGDEILMEFNKEVEKAGKDTEIITAYDRMEVERLVGHEQGYDEGLEEGHKKGLEEGRKKGLEEGRKKGHEEGREEGLKQGIEQARIELAKKMLQKDMPLDEVHSLIPEVSLKDLERIKKELL